MCPDTALAAIAARQHGAFTKAQALRIGLSLKAIRTRIARGQWTIVLPGVYVISGSPPSWERDAMCAVLAFGSSAAASHTTSGYLLGLLEEPSRPLHVSLPRTQHRGRKRFVIPHQATLVRTDIRTVRGIRVTSPNRTLVDLAGLVPRATLEAALDNAIQLGLTTIPSIARYITGRNLGHLRGVGYLRYLLSDRADGAMHKELERMFRRKAEASGLPIARRQFPVAGHKVDFAWPEFRIVVELDGLGGHFSAEKARRDKRRDRDVIRAGFTPVRVSWDDVSDDWPAVEADLRAIFTDRGRTD